MASQPAAQPQIAGYLAPERRHRLAGLGTFAKARPLGAVCCGLLLIVVVIAIFAPAIAPYPPNENHLIDGLQSPSSSHLFGTDKFGRDVMSRVVFGARTSIQVGMLSMLVAVAVSLTLGVTAAYFRGPWDYIVGRVVELAQALPGLVLLITLLATFGRSVQSIGIVLGFTTGVISSRVIRGATLGIAAQQYTEVARSVGCTSTRIILRYLLPNVFPIVIVLATINVGAAIIAEASLSFLGYGVQPPAPSWGGMLSADGRRYMTTAPWLFYAPTGALAVVVFSINMFGDALRDRLDPRLRGGK